MVHLSLADVERPVNSKRLYAALSLAVMAWAGPVRAETVRVVSSGGFAAAYKTLAPGFEKETGDTLVTGWGPSMGETPNAVPVRLARGETIDVVIMVGYALDELVKQGKVVAGSATPLARSLIGIAVKAGAPRPAIGSDAALRQTLLNAKSIAYSDSASGVYVKNELFKKLGIEAEMAGKARMIPAEPVGAVVARGDAEIGFQQISELKPVPGITIAGPLPPDLQKVTVFAAGIVAGAPDPKGGADLIRYLAAPKAVPAIVDSGLEPVAPR